MIILRLLKYLLISSLVTSISAIALIAAWKMDYIEMPAQIEEFIAQVQDMTKMSQELAAAQEQMKKLMDGQRPADEAVPTLEAPEKDIIGSIKETLGTRTIYRWRDEKGNLFITDTPPPKGIKAEEIVVNDGPKFGKGDAVIVESKPTPSSTSTPNGQPDITTLFNGDTEAMRIAEQLQKQREESMRQVLEAQKN